MTSAHQSFSSVKEGANASYIPFLASVPSDLFGIAIAFTDGEVLEVGDTKYEFAIESISKVFTVSQSSGRTGQGRIQGKNWQQRYW